MKFFMKFQLTLLWCFMLGMVFHARGLVADPLPAIGDVIYLNTFNDGTCTLTLNNPSTEPGLIKPIKSSYHEIVNLVSQRIYDYQFYFAQLSNTKPSNTVAYAAALDRLMETFSQNFTTWSVDSTDPAARGKTTGWAATEFLYANELAQGYYAGWSDGSYGSLRVIPVYNNHQIQVYVSAVAQDFANINSPYTTPPFQLQNNVEILGHVTFSMAYEVANNPGFPNAWRFISWNEEFEQLWQNAPSVWPQWLYWLMPDPPVSPLPSSKKP